MTLVPLFLPLVPKIRFSLYLKLVNSLILELNDVLKYFFNLAVTAVWHHNTNFSISFFEVHLRLLIVKVFRYDRFIIEIPWVTIQDVVFLMSRLGGFVGGRLVFHVMLTDHLSTDQLWLFGKVGQLILILLAQTFFKVLFGDRLLTHLWVILF